MVGRARRSSCEPAHHATSPEISGAATHIHTIASEGFHQVSEPIAATISAPGSAGMRRSPHTPATVSGCSQRTSAQSCSIPAPSGKRPPPRRAVAPMRGPETSAPKPARAAMSHSPLGQNAGRVSTRAFSSARANFASDSSCLRRRRSVGDMRRGRMADHPAAREFSRRIFATMARGRVSRAPTVAIRSAMAKSGRLVAKCQADRATDTTGVRRTMGTSAHHGA